MVIQSIVSIAQSLVSDSLSMLVHIKSSVPVQKLFRFFSAKQTNKKKAEFFHYSMFKNVMSHKLLMSLKR